MADERKQLGSGVLELPTLQTYVNTTADRAGLQVKFVEGLAGGRTNEKEIHIPAPNSNITQKDVTKIRHAILHEVGHHIKGPEMFGILKRDCLSPGEEGLGSLLNAFEDSRIERELAKDYVGDKEILIESRGDMYDSANFAKLKAVSPKDKEGTLVATALSLMFETDSSWNPSDILNKSKVTDNLPEHVKDLLDKCEKAGITEALKGTRSTEDCYGLAKQVFEMIYEKSAEQHIKEQQAKAEKEGKGKKKDGEGEGGEKDKPGRGKAAGEGKGDGEKGKARMKEMWSEYIPQTLDGVADPDSPGLHLDYSNFERGHHGPFPTCTEEEIACFDMKLNKNIGKGSMPRLDMTRDDSWVSKYKDDANAKTLANKIRRFLQVKSQAYYVPNQDKGKLHHKNLYRVGVPRVGDGSWNNRVFKRKEQNDVLDVAVTVLVDYSGSMSGQKIRDAIKSSMILTECLSHGLKVPVEVLGFTENGPNLNMLLIKRFDDRCSMETVGKRMVPGTSIMCQNNDGDAILFAYNRLRHRKEKRRMLFVLSDGSPASNRGEADEYTDRVIKKIESQGIVDIYGIGIQDKNVERLYKKNEVLKDSRELESKLLKIVQRRIINEEAH